MNVREHQDAYEFFTRLQDQIDGGIRTLTQPPEKEEEEEAKPEGAGMGRLVFSLHTDHKFRIWRKHGPNPCVPTLEGDGGSKPSEPPPKGAVERVLGGKFAQQIICRNCPSHRSEREEDFVSISVDVRHKRNLEESLCSYVQGELLEGDNQWHCEACGAKVGIGFRV